MKWQLSKTEKKRTDTKSGVLVDYESIAEMLSRVGVSFAIFDLDGNCAFCSPLLAETIGEFGGSLEGFAAALAGEQADRTGMMEQIEKVKKGEERSIVESVHVLGEGAESVLEVHLLALGSEDAPKVAAVVRDTSSEVRLRKEMERLDQLASVGQIAAGIAHEFNNLLTSMLGWAQIANNAKSTKETVSSALDIVEENARRANDISSQLLGVARQGIESKGPIEVPKIVDDVLRLLSWEMDKIGISVVRSIEAVGSCWGNDNRIRQVFINILRNTLDAMPEGGKIEVDVRQNHGKVIASFKDSGPGMPPDVQSRIFDPFFTTKSGRHGVQTQGTGLGLAVCREIMVDHKGSIEVESAPGKGTSFSVLLPVVERRARSHETRREYSSSVPPGVKVLVVDDEPDIGEMVRTALELKGADVVAVSTGHEAIEACRKRMFHVVFVDFTMPGPQGQRIGKELHAISPDLPIIFMSGREVELDPEMRIDDFIKKPFDLNEIQRKLAEVIFSRYD